MISVSSFGLPEFCELCAECDCGVGEVEAALAQQRQQVLRVQQVLTQSQITSQWSGGGIAGLANQRHRC